MEAKTVQPWQVNTVIALLVLLIALMGFQIWENRQSKSVKWAYVIGSEPDENLYESINKAGASGWELIFARRVTNEFSGTAAARYEMIFRRPLPAR